MKLFQDVLPFKFHYINKWDHSLTLNMIPNLTVTISLTLILYLTLMVILKFKTGWAHVDNLPKMVLMIREMEGLMFYINYSWCGNEP